MLEITYSNTHTRLFISIHAIFYINDVENTVHANDMIIGNVLDVSYKPNDWVVMKIETITNTIKITANGDINIYAKELY
jgi:hypothetical protein